MQQRAKPQAAPSSITSIRAKYIDFERVRRVIASGPFDAIICNSPHNATYFSGFFNQDIYFLPERMQFTVWSKDHAPTWVVVEKRKRMLEQGETFIDDIRPYQGEGLDAVRMLVGALRDHGVTGGMIGIEGRFFPAGHFAELQRELPHVTFRSAETFLDSIRAIKTPAEIETLSRIAGITCEAIDAAFECMRRGDTERAVGARIAYGMLERGADLTALSVFGAGPRSGAWHALPTDKPLEEGTIIKVDIGARLDGYLSDIARTVVVGHASTRQREVHAALSEIKDRIVRYIRPEMPASDIVAFGRAQYADLSLEMKWNLLGHSIGLTAHEEPQLYPDAGIPVLAGMALMIECGFTDPPNDSYAVEDLILVGPAGASYLTCGEQHRRLWEIGM